MDAALSMSHVSGRKPLSVLARWTLAALLIGTLLLVYMQVFLVRSFMPPIALMFGVPALIFAALIVIIRRRWAPLLGTLYWVLFLAATAPYMTHDLGHPEFFPSFTYSVMVLATALVGIVAGIGAAMQNY